MNVWCLMQGRTIDQVDTETLAGVFSSKQKALEARFKQKEDPRVYWSIEEKEVDSAELFL